ncbi:alpha-L-rhamnosidase N-terminal domain-containing protein [Paenibacillus sp. GCM10027626]|uniref:alpha-L-rhamnosidase-related protein n=1 Tax=Paenibacillus sp. GCM10027626 TaxID=3273411 RepID=UPI0036398955
MDHLRSAARDLADARWIGYRDERDGRVRPNELICFRQTFDWEELPEEALLHITADYRYTVWINGIWIGQGPVRGWPQRLFYDTYDVTATLRKGHNAIAVLLNALNLATFQYIPSGNPGLMARLIGDTAQGELEVVTDASWRCIAHPSLQDNTPRISTQQAFVEHFDARLEPPDWKLADWPDSTDVAGGLRWAQALEAGVPLLLAPRDIPHLTGEEMYPIRICDRSVVRLPMPAWSIDLGNLLLPDVRDANPHAVRGMLATTVMLDRPMRIRFHFQDRTSGLYTRLSVNGAALQPIDDSGSHWSGLFHYDAELCWGENLLLFWFDGVAHEFTFQAAMEVVDASGDAVVMAPGLHGTNVLAPALPGTAEGRFAFFGRFGPDETELFEKLKRVVSWDAWRAVADGRFAVIPRSSEHTDNVFLRMRHSVTAESSVSATPDHHCCSGNGDYTAISAPPAGEAVQLILEFEKMTAGLIEIEIFGQDGAVVDFYGFEAYRGEQPVHMDSMHNTMRYICKQGWQTYRSLTQRSFRYLTVQLSGFQGHLKLRFIRCLLRTYPSPSVGQFRCNDERLNRIFEMSRWTARLCSDDVFVDCPTYEQAFWVGDAYVMSRATSSLFGSKPLIERCLLLATHSLSRSPIVESQVPSGWENILSTWSLLWALACTDHARRSIFGEFAKRIYPSLRKQALYLHEHLTDEATGLIRSPYWNLLDWAAIDAPSPAIVTHVNAWYAECCRQTGQLATRLGLDCDAETFTRIAETITEGINAHLWDASRQAFADCLYDSGALSGTASEQTQLICFINDIAWPHRRSALLRYVRGEVTDTVRSATPFMRFFKLQALEKAGLTDEMLQEIRVVWGHMTDADSTTCWEDMPGRWAPGYPTRSYCHGWSIAPAYFLPHSIVGIGEINLHTQSVEISPRPGDLRWADGRVMTAKGEIAVRFEAADQEFRASIRLPEGISGWLKLPMEACRVGAILVNGQPAVDARVQNGFWLVPVPGGQTTTIRATAAEGY